MSPGQRRKVRAQPISTNACGLGQGPVLLLLHGWGLPSSGSDKHHVIVAGTCDAGLSEHLHGFKDLKEFVQSLQKPRWVSHGQQRKTKLAP